jgi:hypothetical protein
MNATAAQRDGITHYLGELGGYWHWMPDFWLLDSDEDHNPSEIRDAIYKAYPNVVLLILKVIVPEGEAWAGVFPTATSDDEAEWLNQQWKPTDPWP